MDIKDLYFKHWENYARDNPKEAGSTKNRRMHDMVFPKLLENCTPIAGVACLLYVIRLEPMFDSHFILNGIEDTTRPIFRALLANENCWAILTTKMLPILPPMKLFLSRKFFSFFLYQKKITTNFGNSRGRSSCNYS